MPCGRVWRRPARSRGWRAVRRQRYGGHADRRSSSGRSEAAFPARHWPAGPCRGCGGHQGDGESVALADCGPGGTDIAASGGRRPASSSSTRAAPFSDNRAASTHPAVPAPTTTKPPTPGRPAGQAPAAPSDPVRSPPPTGGSSHRAMSPPQRLHAKTSSFPSPVSFQQACVPWLPVRARRAYLSRWYGRVR